MIDPGDYTIAELKKILAQKEVNLKLIGKLRCDSRKGVQQLAQKYIKQRQQKQRLQNKWEQMNKWEQNLRLRDINHIAGLDEAGRGPLAGPVAAAAVILNPREKILGIDDSKALSVTRREVLYEKIAKKSLAWASALVSPEEIDRLNIQQASILAMKKAVFSLEQQPEYLLIDGHSEISDLDIEQQTIIDGDCRCNCIAAASIMAKVTRDKFIDEYHHQYPQYNFKSNKGYGTAEHIAALKKYGPSPIHRFSFAPVKKYS